MDYEDVFLFFFYPCATTRRCRTVSIVDDLVDEADETFIITEICACISSVLILVGYEMNTQQLKEEEK